jgi:hypothetical protein
VRIGIRESDDRVNNTRIRKKKKKRNTIKNTRFWNHKNFSLLVKVLELFLTCPILVLAFKWKL